MKKFLTSLLTCLLVLIAAFSISGCSPKPALDFDDAMDELIDHDYNIYDMNHEEVSNDSLFLAFDNALVDTYIPQDAIDEAFHASSRNREDRLCMIQFEKSKDANKWYKYIKETLDIMIINIQQELEMYEYFLKKYEDDISNDAIEDYKDIIKYYKGTLKTLEDIIIGKKGKIVWYGTKEAIEDTK